MPRSGTQSGAPPHVHRVSHGICRSCLEEKLADLPPQPLVLAPEPVPVMAPA
jgi:hypothetical protein